MTKVTLTLANTLFLRTVAGKPVNLDVSKLSPEVIAKVFEGGAKMILTNAFNSGGKDRTDTERMGQLDKRMAAWYRGEYAVIERGESQYTAMREQYAQERLSAAGMTRAQVDKAIRETVTRVFGEKESATFRTFLLAVATEKFRAMSADDQAATDAATIAETIEAGLAERTAAAAAERAKLAEGLDVSKVDLGL